MSSKRTISYAHYWTVFTDTRTCRYIAVIHTTRILFHKGGHQLSPSSQVGNLSLPLVSFTHHTHIHTHTHTHTFSRSFSVSSPRVGSLRLPLTCHVLPNTHTHTLSLAPSRSHPTHLPRVTERRLRRLVEERKAERVRVLELPATRVGRGYTCDTVQAKTVVAGAALWEKGSGVAEEWERGSGVWRATESGVASERARLGTMRALGTGLGTSLGERWRI